MKVNLCNPDLRIESAAEPLFVPVPGKVTSLAAQEAFEMMLVNDGLSFA